MVLRIHVNGTVWGIKATKTRDILKVNFERRNILNLLLIAQIL